MGERGRKENGGTALKMSEDFCVTFRKTIFEHFSAFRLVYTCF